MKLLIVDVDNCNGCRTCELACSLKKFLIFSPSHSRISINKMEARGLGIPQLCEHCSKPPCLSVCPTKAISRDEKSGLVIIDSDRCTGCEFCRKVCPYGADTIKIIEGVASICDHCGGDPECVKVCQCMALRYLDSNPSNLRDKQKYAEKRLKYLASETFRRVI